MFKNYTFASFTFCLLSRWLVISAINMFRQKNKAITMFLFFLEQAPPVSISLSQIILYIITKLGGCFCFLSLKGFCNYLFKLKLIKPDIQGNGN